MADKKTSKPQSLRNLLSFILALLILGGGALFYFGLQMIKDYSVEVTESLRLADANDARIQSLQALRTQSQQGQSISTTLDQFFADESNFPSKVRSDISNYAKQTGITGISIAFKNTDTEPAVATVTIPNNVTYLQFVQFLTLVEGNLPKLHVTSLDIEPIEGSDGESVKIHELKIGVTVR